MHVHLRSTLIAAFIVVPLSAAAERTIAFTATEGTWMSVDLSPDGSTIVFDLLGDLYTLPASGGTATRITNGRAYDSQPRWSPDGKAIAFTSDRSGSDNIWVVSPGSEPRAITREAEGGLSAPAWTPDGDYLVARRDPTYNRRGSAEVWLYHRGGGTGTRLTGRGPSGPLNPNGPVVSADGHTIYFSHGQRVLDSTWEAWQLWRADRLTGEVSQVTTGYRGAVRPALSPDGRQVAYVRRDHAQSVLVLRDLETGRERVIRTGLDRDDQRGTTDYDAYPGFGFSRDGRSIVIGTGGKIHRIDVESGADAVIPFTASVSIDIPERPHVTHRIDDGPVSARVIRSASFTPDGSVVFEALGKIWIGDGKSAPRRLTNDAHREYGPAVSPDGRTVAFVSWDDGEGGHVWSLPVAGGEPRQLTRIARQYANPSWSADGSKIVVSWRPPNYGNTANVPEDDVSHDVVWLPSNGGDTRRVGSARPRNVGRWFPVPHFSADGTRVHFLSASSESRTDLVSVTLDGRDRQSIARFRYVEEAMVSPDGRQIAFVSMDDVYVSALPERGSEPMDIDLDKPAAPLRTVTRDGGGYVSWVDGGKALAWCYANVAYRQALDGDAPTAVRIDIKAPRALPSGSTLLRGARILMTQNGRTIDRGDVLVTGGRIAAVGRSGSLDVPGGARVVDVSGKTIMPGLVDMHSHGHYQAQEIFPAQKWQYLADLAYGVTTAREVSAPTRDTMAQADMVETGDMIGPRVYATGWPVFAARDGAANHAMFVRSLDEARRHLRRLKRNGVTWIKQYLQPRREQRQWLQQAALEEGLMITAEGGGLKVQTTLALDGYSGFEHGIPVAPIYDDVVQLMARSGTAYAPTFVAGYAKPGSMDYFYANQNVHEDARASRFIPHDLLDRFTSIRVLIPDDQYQFRAAARGAHAIQKAGGRVVSGGHGNHPGLGPHWEVWSFVEGGMPADDAIRTATLGGAEALGIQADAGTIEPGKLADLVILNANPLENIRNTANVYRVMKAGQIYDPDDLAAKMPFADERPSRPRPPSSMPTGR
jgi:Tol biopolymer transport system component/imidazolonepropionase-like amidohydrolase